MDILSDQFVHLHLLTYQWAYQAKVLKICQVFVDVELNDVCKRPNGVFISSRALGIIVRKDEQMM